MSKFSRANSIAMSMINGPVAMGVTVSAGKLYKGSNCEIDNGKPRERYQPRNSKCVCGSGKKAKACCVVFPKEKE